MSFTCTTKWLDICKYCETLTTTNLVNVHHQSYNFFPVMSTFKIHPLSNFQICNTVLLTMVTMYITSP